MKRIAITLLFILVAIVPSFSQLRLGVSVDPQVSWLSSDRKSIEGDGSIGGVSFGLNVDNYFANRYAFYTGVFIETTGGHLKYRDGSYIDSKDQDNYPILPGQSMKYRLQYITIPTGIKLKTNPIGYSSFYANLGFRTSILTRSKGFSANNTMDGEVLDGVMHRFNFGWQLGIGTEYALGGNVNLVLGINYNNGIVNTLNNSSVHVNLNSFALKLGVIF